MKQGIFIKNYEISYSNPCYIVAEISANHQQDIKKAKRLIEIAKECDANAVKIQTYTADTMTLNCEKDYFKIKKGPWKGQSLYNLYSNANTPWEWHYELKKHATDIGITLISSVFDETAVDFLEKLDFPAYKVASFEIVDIPLIKYIASTGKPIIMSTGIASLSEIQLAVDTIKSQGNEDIILLKCTSTYPAKPKEMNLGNIKILKEVFNLTIGLSDHTLKNEVAYAAVALGAKVIEKHIIENRSDGGPDSQFSIEPNELKGLIKGIRIVEDAISNKVFMIAEREKENLAFRKSLFISEDIKKGNAFNKNNIRSIRPSFGLSPKHFEKILGKRASCDLKRGDPLRWCDIEV